MDTIFAVAARLQSMNVADGLMLILVKATLILLIARLLLAAMPRASAATKHLVATATLVAVACMPLLSVLVPAWQVAVARKVVPVVAQNAAPEAQQKTIGLRDDESVGIAKSLVQAIAPAPVTAMTRAARVVRSTWKGFIVLAAALTAFAFLGHMLAGMIGVWFVARKARPLESDAALLALDEARGQLGLGTDVRLLQSSRVTVPVVWGVFRPFLLLPEDAATWSAERMRVVLLHELAHLKRVDGVSLILTRIAVSLFWFHPLAWSLERAGRNECERACDDLVLASGTRPSEYADHLLDIARTMPAFDPFRAVTLAMSRKSQLEGRLLSILQPGVARRVFSGRGIAIACAVAVAIVVPVSALRLIAQQPEKVQQKAEVKRTAPASGSTVDVRPEVETLEDYFTDAFSTFDLVKNHHSKDLSDKAFDLYKADRFLEAGDAFRRAAQEDDGNDATALYNAACSYALANDAGRATEALKDALAAGWDDFEKIAEDSDFDRIRDDSRFSNLLNRYGSDIAKRRVNYTVERYNEMRSSRTASSDDWFEVGTNLLSLRRLDEARDALEHSLMSGEKHSATLYNLACAYALSGDTKNALQYLDKAIDDGYSDNKHMQTDRDLAAVQDEPGFEALLRKADDLELRNRSWDRTWREAAAWHKRMLDKYPDNGRAWFNYGYASLQARDYETGIAAFQKTLSMKYRPATSAFNIACAYALQDNADAAFQWLERAKASGFNIREQAKHDEDLDSLHEDPRWRRLVGERGE